MRGSTGCRACCLVSLTWTATSLTTAKFYSNTSIDETTLAGVSGVLTHTYTVEVDHDFRRWLTGHWKVHLCDARLPGRRPPRQDLSAEADGSTR